MRTTAKPVVEKLREHILEKFTSDYGYAGEPIENLKHQVRSMQYRDQTVYQAGLDMAEGGTFLIYFTEVKEFLNSLGINPTGKEYDDEKSWKLYCHLVAREIAKLVS